MQKIASPRASPSTPWGALAGVSLALSVFGAAQGLSYPLLTLVMRRQGWPPGLIGVSAATMPFGLLLSAPFVPAMVGFLGARRLAVLCAFLGGMFFLGLGLLQNWFAWFVIRFLVGVVINPLYILGEVWALALASPSQRGRVMGFFNTFMSIGYAAGPLVLAIAGPRGLLPFLAATAGFFLCAAMLALLSGQVSDFAPQPGEQSHGGVREFARKAPALLVAVATAAATQGSTYSLLPVFGVAYGLSERAVAALLTVLSAGNILLQVPLGLAAERVGARTVILACAVLTVFSAMLLPVAIRSQAIWPLLLVLGGVGYGVYTMATVELGERFSGSALVAGNSAFALLWGAGGVVGAPIAGTAMQTIGPAGLPATLCTLTSAMFVFVALRTYARVRKSSG